MVGKKNDDAMPELPHAIALKYQLSLLIECVLPSNLPLKSFTFTAVANSVHCNLL